MILMLVRMIVQQLVACSKLEGQNVLRYYLKMNHSKSNSSVEFTLHCHLILKCLHVFKAELSFMQN